MGERPPGGKMMVARRRVPARASTAVPDRNCPQGGPLPHPPALLRAGMILLALLLLMGCGNNDGDDGGVPVAGGDSGSDDNGVAEALRLRLGDLPAGWSETEAAAPAAGALFDACAEQVSPRPTGRAATGEFSASAQASFSQSVTVFDKKPTAQAVHEQLTTVLACVVAAVEAGRLDHDEIVYRGPALSPVPFPSSGDRLDAYRLELRREAAGATSARAAGVTYIDFVYVTEGAFAFVIRATGHGTPFDAMLLEQLARTGAVRLPAR